MKPQVVILAGGLGTRLRPITEKIPKPLVPVADEPFLHWQLLDVAQQGFDRVLLLVSYLGEQVQQVLGDGSKWGLTLTYAFEPTPLGTGGALVNAYDQLEDDFILLNGDSFLQAPLEWLYEDFLAGQADALVSTYAGEAGEVPVIPNLRLDPDEKVLAYKKNGGLAEGFDTIDSGIYVLRKSLFEPFHDSAAESAAEAAASGAVALPKVFQLEELWPSLIAEGKFVGFAVPERFYDIGTPERLQEFEEKVRDYFEDSVSD